MIHIDLVGTPAEVFEKLDRGAFNNPGNGFGIRIPIETTTMHRTALLMAFAERVTPKGGLAFTRVKFTFDGKAVPPDAVPFIIKGAMA